VDVLRLGEPDDRAAGPDADDQTTYNYVIVYGESVDNAVPVQAVAFDNDPNSPTYYLGPYGSSRPPSSPADHHHAQAQQAANALLLAVKGASENVR